MNNYITIDGFEELTEQQLFDMSVNHIRKKGKPAVTSLVSSLQRRCSYEHGCAASVFIDKQFISVAEDNGSWLTLFNRKLVPVTYFNLIFELQIAHDSNAFGVTSENFLKKFECSVKNIAEKYNLKYTEVNHES